MLHVWLHLWPLLGRCLRCVGAGAVLLPAAVQHRTARRIGRACSSSASCASRVSRHAGCMTGGSAPRDGSTAARQHSVETTDSSPSLFSLPETARRRASAALMQFATRIGARGLLPLRLGVASPLTEPVQICLTAAVPADHSAVAERAAWRRAGAATPTQGPAACVRLHVWHVPRRCSIRAQRVRRAEVKHNDRAAMPQ